MSSHIAEHPWSSGYDASLTRWRSPVQSLLGVCMHDAVAANVAAGALWLGVWRSCCWCWCSCLLPLSRLCYCAISTTSTQKQMPWGSYTVTMRAPLDGLGILCSGHRTGLWIQSIVHGEPFGRARNPKCRGHMEALGRVRITMHWWSLETLGKDRESYAVAPQWP